MNKKTSVKPLVAALGATFAVSLAAAAAANASENPFAAVEFASGYTVADGHGEGKCGEAKCGGDKDDKKGGEGKCGEAKCGSSE